MACWSELNALSARPSVRCGAVAGCYSSSSSSSSRRKNAHFSRSSSSVRGASSNDLANAAVEHTNFGQKRNIEFYTRPI